MLHEHQFNIIFSIHLHFYVIIFVSKSAAKIRIFFELELFIFTLSENDYHIRLLRRGSHLAKGIIYECLNV